jgi:NAD(P)-dependent dehydrogenase (short-subunit alcohol dehydrogenase family)
MAGKIAIVTGASSGIGRAIAEGLAGQGAKVVLAVRNLDKGEAAKAAIAQITGSKDLFVFKVDTSDQASVKAFAAEFKRKFKKLDVLVNNAGVNLPKQQKTAKGLDLVFATNVLGYYWMTLAFEDLLKASKPARVVNVASTFAGDLDLTDPQFAKHRKYNGIKAYKQSKACDRLLSWAFSRKLAPKGVIVNAMAPGFVYTGLYREMKGFALLLMRFLGMRIGVKVAAGADTAIWLASSPEVKRKTGIFYYKRQETPCEFADQAKEDELIKICEALSK